MDGQLTSHHLAIMRRSLACGGIPSDQMAWILSEAARLLDERDQARSVLTELVRPVSEVRRLLNELHTVLLAEGSEPVAGPNEHGTRRSPDVYENLHKKL